MLALMLAGMLGIGTAFAAQAEEKDVLFTIWDGSGAVVHEAVRGAGEGPAPSAEREIPPLLAAPRPKYPKRLIGLGMTGWVRLKFTINERGEVEDPEVLESAPRTYFARAALQAISRYRFAPPMLDGAPAALPDVTVRMLFEPD